MHRLSLYSVCGELDLWPSKGLRVFLQCIRLSMHPTLFCSIPGFSIRLCRNFKSTHLIYLETCMSFFLSAVNLEYVQCDYWLKSNHSNLLNSIISVEYRLQQDITCTELDCKFMPPLHHSVPSVHILHMKLGVHKHWTIHRMHIKSVEVWGDAK
jgi:hypothetical protein